MGLHRSQTFLGGNKLCPPSQRRSLTGQESAQDRPGTKEDILNPTPCPRTAGHSLVERPGRYLARDASGGSLWLRFSSWSPPTGLVDDSAPGTRFVTHLLFHWGASLSCVEWTIQNIVRVVDNDHMFTKIRTFIIPQRQHPRPIRPYYSGFSRGCSGGNEAKSRFFYRRNQGVRT